MVLVMWFSGLVLRPDYALFVNVVHEALLAENMV